ncbi:bifunctional oligoribonuclease/PAP phosphatase NrnA [Nocardia puris]|uniref:Phosphoesterase RecJ-like protein n=1 Tax=Nocardia puris TaxID=208602 RepID=A0A366E3C5_9NOCA|nr:bifunctional oligoribonuclease/PAP phosphatase NrnA [Nocardia puris]MBF6212571.1 bifunctional oligoribonuclease/PAP phosphatase NrnA [Nocardia puris]MBF6369151.1 bifunctional oligoribonuclease/PAP phosphatase NrnA [Nocardia puris]MBF6461160.1 bifunctional oligoribonuclease/PAP phosphatase NrnA [Nocardia puris]RBO96615.1 phosphoesterase RecJ-like protein [Nocardia puris]
MTNGDPGLDAAVEALTGARSVTVLCHVQPDADTIGSGLALALVLHRRGVPVWVSFAEPAELPASMRTLPGVTHLVPPDEVPRAVDLVVAVDCGSANRLGALADRLDGARTTLVVDHHRSNTRFGQLNLVDPSAESTTSVIARLLDAWGEPIDAEVAHCLYAGLVTDTGSFRWVRPGTHQLAERLLATGIDGAEIARALLDTHPFDWLPMLSRVLGSARLEPGARGGTGLAYAFVRRDDVTGVGPEEIESVIDIVRTTAEAGIAAVFKESRTVDGRWTVSLRSRDTGPGARDGVDVAEIATALGGGGHRYAAGYTTHGGPEDVVRALLVALG